MDINIVYNKMIEKLRMSNSLDIVKKLENSAIGAATGSEGLMLTGGYLLSLKHENSSVYELIEGQIKEYLEYCKQNGIVIK